MSDSLAVKAAKIMESLKAGEPCTPEMLETLDRASAEETREIEAKLKAKVDTLGHIAEAVADVPWYTPSDPLPTADHSYGALAATDPFDPKWDEIESIIGHVGITQDAVARVFEIRFKEELRYCHQWGKWLQWNRYKWRTEITELAFYYARVLCRRIGEGKKQPASSGFCAGVEKFAQSSRTFATEPRQWDANNWKMNTPTGCIDLQTGSVQGHTRADYITKSTSVSPSDAPRPLFERFLRDITLEDDALVLYLQKSLGSCLSGAIQEHFLLVWYGTGRNGKNTLGDLVTWILGDYAKVIPTETLMQRSNEGHLTELANLRGLRLAISSEVSEGSFFNESRINSLSGDEMISARFMRQDLFEFPRTHKHLIFGNHRPMLRTVTPALKKRLHIVPFKADFTDDAVCDPLMPMRLRAEAPQILQWLIEGHAMWLEDGYLKKCSAVQKETDGYFEAQSTPEMWLAECCETDDPTAQGPAGELYKSFKSWKEERGEGVISQTRWGEWMTTRFPKTRSNGWKYNGVQIRNSSIYTPR